MRIGGLQKLSMVDYPGKMACTIFFTRCNFRCPYCHNSGLVIPEQDHPWMEEDEVLAFLKKRQGILEGVCISGGEPLLQGKNIIPFLEKIKELGYPIKLDTNGTSPELLQELCKKGLVDYVAMDIKNSRENYGLAIGYNKKLDNPEHHMNIEECMQQDVLLEKRTSRATDILSKIEESVSFLLTGKVDYEFRTTLVKGIHEPQDIESICHWIHGAKAWYLQNFTDSGAILSKDFVKMESFSKDEMMGFVDIGKAHQMSIHIRNI